MQLPSVNTDHAAPVVRNRMPQPSANGSGQPARPRRRAGWRGWLLAGAAVAVAAALLAVGTAPRLRRSGRLEAEAAEAANAPRLVRTITPRLASARSPVTLPGFTRAMQDVTLSARTSGYLKRFLADLGDRVEAGQLLAEIETPEVDQELAQTRATLEQAKATVTLNEAKLSLAITQLERNRRLIVSQAVAQQDFDVTRADADTARAAVRESRASVQTQQANVRRLEALQGFQTIRAPFGGTVTARNVDKGALISSGSGPGVTNLFALAQTDPMRVFVNVPQAVFGVVGPGLEAEVLLPEAAGRVFPGKVARTAGAFSPTTNTMPVEVHVPNPAGALAPGLFVQVRFLIDRKVPRPIVPATALALGAEGPRVACVGRGGAVEFRKVTLGRDLGTEVEIVAGLTGSETLVNNPPDDLKDGEAVRAAEDRPAVRPPP
jgi:RND family efflux transporter MFP subunit